MVTAFDTGAPAAQVSEPVFITVDRNLNTPTFVDNNYAETIPDYYAIGTSVITVEARDSDITSPENVVSYTVVGQSGQFSMFSIHPITGVITTNRLLTLDNVNNYRVS